jgi:hypothetical protein
MCAVPPPHGHLQQLIFYMLRLLKDEQKEAPHLVANDLGQCGVVHVSHQQPIAQRSIRTQQGIALLPREETLQPDTELSGDAQRRSKPAENAEETHQSR